MTTEQQSTEGQTTKFTPPASTDGEAKHMSPPEERAGILATLKRNLETLKKWWKQLMAVVGVITAIIAWYNNPVSDRQRRRAEVDRTISEWRKPTATVSSRIASFDSLRTSNVSDNLEPHTIQGIFQLVRALRPLRTPCASVDQGNNDSRAVTADIQGAFATIRNLQSRKHGLLDRAINRILELTSSKLV